MEAVNDYIILYSIGKQMSMSQLKIIFYPCLRIMIRIVELKGKKFKTI